MRSIDYVQGLSRNTLASHWLGECLAAANLELGLRWLHDRARPPCYPRTIRWRRTVCSCFALVLLACSSHASVQFSDGDATQSLTSSSDVIDVGRLEVDSRPSDDVQDDSADAGQPSQQEPQPEASRDYDAATEAALPVICGGIQCAPGNGFEPCCVNERCGVPFGGMCIQ
jgi:hypothetical protein